jgi:hypothetical protein
MLCRLTTGGGNSTGGASVAAGTVFVSEGDGSELGIMTDVSVPAAGCEGAMFEGVVVAAHAPRKSITANPTAICFMKTSLWYRRPLILGRRNSNFETPGWNAGTLLFYLSRGL